MGSAIIVLNQTIMLTASNFLFMCLTALLGLGFCGPVSKRAIDSLGNGNLLRSIDSLGKGNLLRSMDNLDGNGNLLRSMDTLRNGNVLRQLDTLGRGNII